MMPFLFYNYLVYVTYFTYYKKYDKIMMHIKIPRTAVNIHHDSGIRLLELRRQQKQNSSSVAIYADLYKFCPH